LLCVTGALLVKEFFFFGDSGGFRTDPLLEFGTDARFTLLFFFFGVFGGPLSVTFFSDDFTLAFLLRGEIDVASLVSVLLFICCPFNFRRGCCLSASFSSSFGCLPPDHERVAHEDSLDNVGRDF
jgi:hypothetical protein